MLYIYKLMLLIIICKFIYNKKLDTNLEFLLLLINLYHLDTIHLYVILLYFFLDNCR